jgi:glycosyltransferase involved in cell wall biosynthesis
MNQPLVSVVIVCHNDWPHLELAIESALCQSHPAVEVIVVDNASADQTESEIRSRYIDRVRYVRQGPMGAAGGRNAGFALARGKYIQILDGDDMLAPNKIAVQVAYLEANPDIDIAYGDFRTFRSTPDVPADSLVDIDTEDYPDMKKLLMGRCPGPPIIFLFRRTVVDRAGWQSNDIYYEDYEYWIRCAFANCRFARTPGAWVFYRRRYGQKSEHLNRAALAELEVLRRARTYVVEEPYKKQLAEKISRLEYAFAHYYLWTGDLTNARQFLAAALQSAPPHLRFSQSRVVGWLSKLSIGPVVYGLIRRMRRLPPPFAPVSVRAKAAAA